MIRRPKAKRVIRKIEDPKIKEEISKFYDFQSNKGEKFNQYIDYVGTYIDKESWKQKQRTIK